MEQTLVASNPFALMLDPSAVVLAMEQSDRLARLKSRICRPLDKLVGGIDAGEYDTVAEVTADAASSIDDIIIAD